MKKVLYITLFIFLLSPKLFAAMPVNPSYVSPTGSGSECTIGSPCALSYANSNADAGDTVYFRAGDYSTALSPSYSGTLGNVILWKAYNGETVNLTNSTAAINVSDRTYQHFYGFTVNTAGYYISTQNPANHIEVEQCSFTGSHKFVGLDAKGADWNIHNNEFGPTYQATTDAGENQPMGSSHSTRIYIHDNTFTDCGGHGCLQLGGDGFTTYSVIKDNTFTNTGLWTGDQYATSDCIVSINKASNYNLVEGNTFYEDETNFGDGITAAFKTGDSSYNIFRKNIIYNMDQFAGLSYTAGAGYGNQGYNMFYNNTVYNSGYYDNGSSHSGAFFIRAYSTNTNTNNQIVNNIISDNHRYAFAQHDLTYAYSNKFRGNWLYGITGSEVDRDGSEISIHTAQTDCPAEYFDNTDDDLTAPKFTNPGNAVFTLQSDSPCRNTGLWLTTITSATNSSGSNQFLVDNQYFFSKGLSDFSLLGDHIKLSNGQDAIITNVNYSKKQITVDRNVTWTGPSGEVLGTGVALFYYGSAPDIGAIEFEEGQSPDSTAPEPDPATIASTNPDSSSQITVVVTSPSDPSTPVQSKVIVDNTDCGAQAGTGASTDSYQESDTHVFTGLDPDHCYGFKAQYEDSVPNEGTATATASTLNTKANVSNAPSFTGATASTLDIDTIGDNGNPAWTEYLVVVVSTVPDDQDIINKYVRSDGSLDVYNSSDCWMTKATLEALTLSGLNESTTYGVLSRTRNADGINSSRGATGYGTTMPGGVNPGTSIVLDGVSLSGVKKN